MSLKKEIEFKDEDERVTYCTNCNEIGAEWDDYCELCGERTVKIHMNSIKESSKKWTCAMCGSSLLSRDTYIENQSESFNQRFILCPRCKDWTVHFLEEEKIYE